MSSTAPVVLITGASSGIGKATARLLSQNGYVVYGAARRWEVMEDLRQMGVKTIRMDITSEEAVQAAVDTVIRAESRIDVLINNAGYGSTGALEDVPIAEAKGQFDVNVFGLIGMTQLVLPHMRAQGSGTIVNLSSIGGRVATPLSGWYNATKYAVEALSDSLRLEVKRFGINVVIIEPGGIQTEWSGIAAANARRNSGETVYRSMVNKLTTTFAQYDRKLSHPDVIARLIHQAVRARRPRTRYAAGFGAAPVLLLRRALPDWALDKIILSRF